MENKYRLSPPNFEPLIDKVIALSLELQDIAKIKQQYIGEDRYCCISVSERKMLKGIGSDMLDFSVNIKSAYEGSEVLDFWRKNVKNFLPYGFQIAKVDEYCDIYSNILLCRLVEFCKTI